MALPYSVFGPFREHDSIVIRGTLMDNAATPAAIPGSALVSCVFTLYSSLTIDGVTTYPIINNRDHVDIKTKVNESGVLTLPLTTEDMSIDHVVGTENHRTALIEWVWNVDQRGSWEIQLQVRDVNLVGP
jgi:hypothetical protein